MAANGLGHAGVLPSDFLRNRNIQIYEKLSYEACKAWRALAAVRHSYFSVVKPDGQLILFLFYYNYLPLFKTKFVKPFTLKSNFRNRCVAPPSGAKLTMYFQFPESAHRVVFGITNTIWK